MHGATGVCKKGLTEVKVEGRTPEASHREHTQRGAYDIDIEKAKLVHTPEGTKKFIILETLLEKENAIGLSRVYVRVKVGTGRYPWGYTGNIKEYEVEWREERGGSFGNCYLSREYLTFLFIYSCTGEFYHRNAPERFRRPDKIIDDWVCYAASVYGQKGVASRQGSPLCPEIDKHF